MEIKPFKMKVTPEQCKKVQEIVFRNGYEWFGGGADIQLNTNVKVLYFYGTPPDLTCSDSLYRHPDIPVLTYEEFIELYDFKLPEKWCLRITPENKELITSWRKNYTSSFGYIHSPVINKGLNLNSEWRETKHQDYTEISTEQFRKYVLKEELMEKKIVGYKLKDKDFQRACEFITGFNFDFQELDFNGEWPVRIDINGDKTICYERLEKARVLDLWFEPVYEEEEFKVGDWVTVEKYIDSDRLGRHHYKIGETFKIVNIDDSTSSKIKKWARKSDCFSGISITSLRKATLEEVKKATKVILPFGDTQVKVYSDYIETEDGYLADCKEISRLLDTLSSLPKIGGYKVDLHIESEVTIGCKSGTLREIVAIYNQMNRVK